MSRTSTASSSRRSAERARVVERLEALGLRPSRALGQSFLLDEHVADAEAALVAEGPPPYLEIGPGLGALTEALLRRGVGPLTVVERDRRLARHLSESLPGTVTVRAGPAERVDLGAFGTVCGNLPFRVATPLLLAAVRAGVPSTVALVQAEVAERILAGPGGGAFGRLTLAVGAWATSEGFLPVPSEAFEPVPAVAGRVVRLTARPGGPVVPDPPAFEELTRRLFSARRKQLKNLLPGALPRGWEPPRAAASAGWPTDWPSRRPEELPAEAYYRLARALDGAPA